MLNMFKWILTKANIGTEQAPCFSGDQNHKIKSGARPQENLLSQCQVNSLPQRGQNMTSPHDPGGASLLTDWNPSRDAVKASKGVSHSVVQGVHQCVPQYQVSDWGVRPESTALQNHIGKPQFTYWPQVSPEPCWVDGCPPPFWPSRVVEL